MKQIIAASIIGIAAIASACIVRSGLVELASGGGSHGTRALATTRPIDEALLAADQALRPGDIAEVSVGDIIAEGQTSMRTCRLGMNGKIRLWLIGDVQAAGAGSDELEKQIAKAYGDAKMLPHAIVAVTARRPMGD